MSTNVVTISNCDRCGLRHEREGAEGYVPPVEWASVKLHYRWPGAGWSGGGRRVDAELCPSCARAVEALMQKAD